MSSSTIPTISLEMARKMRPRPPSTIFLAQNDPMRASSPFPNRNNMSQHFSLMSLDEKAQPIMQFSHQQDMSVNSSRSPSVMSTRLIEQKRILPDNASDYSIDQRSRLKDSGFNSTHGGTGLTRSATESSHSSSGRHSISIASVQQQQQQHTHDSTINSNAFYLDEEDEDLIDPEHMSVIESNRPPSAAAAAAAAAAYKENDRFSVETAVLPEQDKLSTKQDAYVDWVNAHIQGNIKSLTDLSSGQVLLEFLENLTNKEVLRPIVMPDQTLNAQRMDLVITAFKFMSLEGVEMDGSCTIRGIHNYVFVSTDINAKTFIRCPKRQ